MISRFLFPVIFLGLFIYSCKPATESGDNANGNTEIPNDTIVEEKKDELPASAFVLKSDQAGPFRLGYAIPENSIKKYQVRMEKNTRQYEGGSSNEAVTIVSFDDEDLLWLKPGYFKADSQQFSQINEIVVVSPKYKTTEGIGIGSTIEEFGKAYPDMRVWYTYVSTMYVAETDKLKLQFLLDANDYTARKPSARSEQTKLKVSDFKPEGKITRVRIIED